MCEMKDMYVVIYCAMLDTQVGSVSGEFGRLSSQPFLGSHVITVTKGSLHTVQSKTLGTSSNFAQHQNSPINIRNFHLFRVLKRNYAYNAVP